jgi:hypothetical protein
MSFHGQRFNCTYLSSNAFLCHGRKAGVPQALRL